jgi:ATP/maltotriose-dependent transcriptional regulator MalT
MIREVIQEGLSLPRRQELHLRAAEAIETVHAGSLDRHLAALAMHYRLSGADSAKTIDYATRAGDTAAAVYAFDEALRLYDLALEAARLRGGSEEETASAELQVNRGESLSALGRWPEARSAFDAAAAGLQGERRADVLLMLANAGTSGPPDVSTSRRYAGLALDLAVELGREDLEMAAHALIAQCDQAEGKFKTALIAFRKAYSQVEAFPAVRKHQVFPHFSLALYYAGRIEEAVGIGKEIANSALTAHRDPLSVATLGNLGLALTSAGLYDEALQTFASAREVARSHGAAGIQIPLARTVGMSTLVHVATGDYARAGAIAEEAREIARSADIILPVVSEAIDLITISVRRGDLDGVDELVYEVTANLDKGGGAHGALWQTRLTVARAEMALARAQWRTALDLSREAVVLARELGRPKYESLALSSQGKALLGLGRRKEAIPLLAEAVEVARSMGDPSLFLHNAAAALAAGGDEHLATDARLAVERMLANISDATMRRNFEGSAPVQDVYKLSGGASAPFVPAKTVYPDGLSEREVDVLRLIAGGSSNREIASELVISVRTVERHITNIYGKIGARGKADATSYALRQSLL